MELLIDALVDGGLDTLKMLPFLLVAFLFLESLEHYSEGRRDNFLTKIGAAGPAAGAIFGCVPQCGFSVAAANLYAGGVITVGTLLAVFLSTSDEAILLLMGHPGQAGTIFKLLAVKVVCGIVFGYAADILLRNSPIKRKRLGAICGDCGCHEEEERSVDASTEVSVEEEREHDLAGESHGSYRVFRAALYHTAEVFVYLLSFNILLNILLGAVGIEWLSGLLFKDSLLQPVLAAFLGLIPNCAASVILTEFYLSGVLSFGAAVSGLLSGAGVGLAVLFKIHREKKENLKITGMLLFAAILSGIFLQIAVKS
ncbi:MAG: arsenic efflux protein [Lachnospiraceae bacterium]|nr:arsenic efflux protein [Lachnospiraceae bacterium]